jgi:hypothetical protein
LRNPAAKRNGLAGVRGLEFEWVHATVEFEDRTFNLNLNVSRALYLRPSAELQFASGGQPPREWLLQAGTVGCIVVVIGSFFAVQPLIDLAQKAIASL